MAVSLSILDLVACGDLEVLVHVQHCACGHPGVVEDLLQADPVVGTDLQAAADQVLAVL